MQKGTRVIIDTDAGVDDAIALILGMTAPRKVDLITCSYGNCALSDVKTNVAKCIKARRCDPRPATAVGASFPLAGEASRIEASYFHGKDGLGDVSHDDPGNVHLCPQDLLSDHSDATTAILSLCRTSLESNETITIITLGPLTNLALALQHDAATGGNLLLRTVSQIVIMGGCGNNRGNATRTAEFNVAADPEAAAIVFNALQQPSWSHCRISVVPWELCKAFPIPWTEFDRFVYANNNNSVRAFIAAISCNVFPPAANRPIDVKRGSGAVICDLLAVAIAMDWELVAGWEDVHVEVELHGKITRGLTVLDEGHCYDGVERLRSVRWIKEVRVERYLDVFASMFEE